MKTKELIEVLKTLDPDGTMPVILAENDSFYEADDLSVSRLLMVRDGLRWAFPDSNDLKNGSGISVVTIF